MKNPNAWYGCRPDKIDRRDHVMRPMAVRIPAAVDARPHCPPVMDQSSLGSCTGHGITGAFRYERMMKGLRDIPLSRLQLYFDERKIEGTIASDAGAEIRDGIKCVKNIGVAHESLWPYKISKFKTRPTAAVYADALKIKATGYERVAVSATALRQAIAMGHTPVIGVMLYESFESDAVTKNGIVPMPAAHEQIVGGHCLYVVGYGQHRGYFTVRNSWATDWGDKGDCYFPMEYLGDPDLGSDYWIVKL